MKEKKIREKLSVGVKTNLDEYTALLSKATELSMLLKNTIDKINNFNLELEIVQGGDKD